LKFIDGAFGFITYIILEELFLHRNTLEDAERAIRHIEIEDIEEFVIMSEGGRISNFADFSFECFPYEGL